MSKSEEDKKNWWELSTLILVICLTFFLVFIPECSRQTGIKQGKGYPTFDAPQSGLNEIISIIKISPTERWIVLRSRFHVPRVYYLGKEENPPCKGKVLIEKIQEGEKTKLIYYPLPENAE